MTASTYPREYNAAEWAKATPSVVADRIECDGCGAEFIGDPADGETCPRCRQ